MTVRKLSGFMRIVSAALIVLCLLASVPAAPAEESPGDQESLEAEPGAVPSEEPEKLAVLNALFTSARAQIVVRDGEPEYGEKLVFAVYQGWDDEDPVLSYINPMYVYDCIPEERLANSLDEADTIVFIWADYNPVGRYSNGASAEACRMMVGIYNRKEDCFYKSFKALSTSPPSSIRDNKTHRGEYTPHEVVKLLAERLGE